VDVRAKEVARVPPRKVPARMSGLCGGLRGEELDGLGGWKVGR